MWVVSTRLKNVDSSVDGFYNLPKCSHLRFVKFNQFMKSGDATRPHHTQAVLIIIENVVVHQCHGGGMAMCITKMGGSKLWPLAMEATRGTN